MSHVAIKATDPQLEFHRLKCPFPAFVAGMGTGKSETMCNQAIIDSALGGNGSLIGLYAPTYDLIRLITAPRMEDKLQRFGIKYTYNKSENIIRTGDRGMGDFILRTMDNPARIVGYETYRAHLDEIDTLGVSKAEEVFERVMQRNRQTPANAQDGMNRVSSYCTPEGFGFMYKTWDQNPQPGYVQIQASTYSNPFLPDSYIENLKNKLTPQLFDAYVMGEYVNLTSGSVYPEFDRKLNLSTQKLSTEYSLIVGCDFNVGNMSAVIFHELDNGEIHAVAEERGAHNTQALASRLRARFGKDWHGAIYVYPDATNGRDTTSNTTDHQILRDYGMKVIANQKNPAVVDRVNCVNVQFCNHRGVRRLFVSPDCPELIHALEIQTYDKNGKPDKSSGIDDIVDAFGYPIVHLRPIRI